MRITMLGICALLAAGVFVAMFLSICQAQRRTEGPPGASRGLAMELLWAAIPSPMVIAAAIPAAIKILVVDSAKMTPR
jgi:heme/copper-type cytochrome/quinol oxidase subunit 2